MKRTAFVLILCALIVVSCSSVRVQKEMLIPPGSLLPEVREQKCTLDLGRGNTLAVYRFANGLEAVLIEMPGSTVCYGAIAVGVGGRYEPDSHAGISHLLEHLIFKENEKSKPVTAIRSTGGSINALTDMEQTTYYFTVRPEHFPRSMRALSAMVMEPGFTGEDLEQEREVVLEELAMGKNDPRALAISSLVKKVFPGSPLTNLIIGTKRSIKRIRLEDLRAYHRAYYVPDNMIVVAAGRIDAVEALGLIHELFGQQERSPVPAVSFSTPEIGVHSVSKKIPIRQSFFITALLTPGMESAEYDAMQLLDVLMGSTAGSLLYRRIVIEEGLTDEFSHFWYPLSDSGVWALFFSLHPDDMDTVSRIVSEEFDKILRGELSREDFLLARRTLLAKKSIQLNTPGAVAGFEVENLRYRGSVQTLDEYTERIERITREELMAVASRFLAPENRVTVELSPARGPEKWFLALKFLLTKKL
jgi:zinc protease